jgi:multisubunit Na+/H+ antiporter MnhB subunit
MSGTVFDVLLALTLVALAWRVLHAPDAFEAVVVFITLGLLMAIAWARLSAPDIALAEAAIGAGLTGVLLLDTLRALRMGAGDPSGARVRPQRSWLALLASLALAGVLLAAVLAIPRDAPSLLDEVALDLPRSGVSQPVTAVLLNFRGYDTWLELGVLLIAVVAVLSLRTDPGLTGMPPGNAGAPLLWLVRLLVPMVVLVAGYLLWLGKSAAGGAFQAGVLLGAAGVLLWLAGRRPVAREWQWRVLLVTGFAVFLGIGMGSTAAGGLLFEYPGEWAGTLIMVIETGAAVSIGATMSALFIGLHFRSGEIAAGGERP